MSEDSKIIPPKEDLQNSVESASTTTLSGGFKSKTKKNARKGVEEGTKRSKQLNVKKTMIYRQIGAKIAYYRTLRQMSQRELANKVNLSTSTIGRIERGKYNSGVRNRQKYALKNNCQNVLPEHHKNRFNGYYNLKILKKVDIFMKSTQLDNALSEFGNAAVDEVKRQADTQIQSAANALQSKVIDKIDTKVLRNAATQTLGEFASVDGILNAKSVDDVVDNFGNKLADEVKGEVKQQVDKAIQSVATTVQKKFINKIGDKTLRNASTQVLGKLSSFDGIMGAFNSIQGNAGLLKETLGGAGRDIEKFLGGKMDRADLMVSLADRAENYIEDTFTKMATVYAAEFGPLAPEIGKLGGYIAANMFREFVSPFVNAAVEAKRARKEYEELHEIIEAAIQQMRLQREQFEKATAELFARRQNLIDNSLNELDAAISVKDVNKSATALGTITEEFGGKQKFKTLEDFVDFMTNNDEEWGI